MNEKLTRLIVEELGALLPRNQVIEHVCVAGNLRRLDAELLVRLVEVEQQHALVRKQGPFLVAMSVVLILIGMLPYALALYVTGVMAGVFPSPGPASATEVEIPIPLPFSVSALLEGLREMVATLAISFALLPSGIVGLYQTVRRYHET